MQFYNKVFSSTRHGFLGAGVVSQPLSHVWAAVSDPTLWPLYHKPIQTARLHQRVTNNIHLGKLRSIRGSAWGQWQAGGLLGRPGILTTSSWVSGCVLMGSWGSLAWEEFRTRSVCAPAPADSPHP